MRKVLIFVLLLHCLFIKAWDFKVDDICYTILSDDDLTVSITGYDNVNYIQNLNIPEVVSKFGITYSVISISDVFLSSYSRVKNVYIPKSITELKAKYFLSKYISNIFVDDKNPVYKSIDGVLVDRKGCLIYFPAARTGHQYIPDGVKVIGESSFSSCNLSSLTMPNTVKVIKNRAFYLCDNFDEIHFSENLDSIYEEAFCNCHFMEIILPNSLKFLGRDAFADCEQLRKIHIPKNVFMDDSLGVFSSCWGLKDITIDEDNQYYSVIDNVLYNKEQSILLRFPPKSDITEFSIPSSVVSIGRCAFHTAKNLQKVIIPSSVEIIKAATFYYCTGLKEVFCYAVNPPITPKEELSSEDPWDFSSRERATLYVPKGRVEAYRNVTVPDYQFGVRTIYPWGSFMHIEEIESTGINSHLRPKVSSNSYFSLNGVLVGNKSQKKGIIIKDGKKYISK